MPAAHPPTASRMCRGLERKSMKMYSDLFWRLARAAIISKSADGFAAHLQRDAEIGDRELAAVGDGHGTHAHQRQKRPTCDRHTDFSRRL